MILRGRFTIAGFVLRWSRIWGTPGLGERRQDAKLGAAASTSFDDFAFAAAATRYP